MNEVDRFWAKVERGPGCWRWTGTHVRGGYPQAWFGGKHAYAHRVSYVLSGGVIPDGYDIDHLCRNRGCVNPDHLEAVTHRVNVRRSPIVMAIRRTCSRGHHLSVTARLLPNGRRRCVECKNEVQRQWRMRLRQSDDEIQPVDPHLEGTR